MKSPFENTDKAFCVFYDDVVVVETKGGERTTLNCFLSQDNTADPIDENMMETTAEQVQISFPKSSWAFIGSIKRGDKIIRVGDEWTPEKVYVVQSVSSDYVLGFIVHAKSE